MASVLTCSVRAAGPILLLLRGAGIELPVVAERLGLAPALLIDSDARLPVDRLLVPLWNLAAELLKDPLVGLHAVESVARASFDVLSYLISASANLEEALTRVVRYFRLITDGGTYELERASDGAWWRYQPADLVTAGCQHDSIFALAVAVGQIRLWSDPSFAPRVVKFPVSELHGVEELEAFFRAPIELGADQCAFRFDAVELERPLRTADPKLAKYLQHYADAALTALPRLGQVSSQVRDLLAQGLPGGQISLQCVAAKLAMSERSLQRQLKMENTSLKQLVEELRRQLAMSYLQRHELSVSEVAYLLGFSERAPFFRAFKKWTGLTPGDFRRALRNGKLVCPGLEAPS